MADCLTVVQEALATVRKHASQSKTGAREQDSRKGARRSIGKKIRTTPTSATVQKWSAAVRQAGRELGLKGFASVRKGTEFHSKATEIQLRRARDRLGGPLAKTIARSQGVGAKRRRVSRRGAPGAGLQECVST